MMMSLVMQRLKHNTGIAEANKCKINGTGLDWIGTY